MIRQRLAFNRYTTAGHTIERYVPGYFDDKNNWIIASLEPPVRISITPIAYGDRDSGVSGQTLKATDIGERQPAFMQVHSPSSMPMKSILNIYGLRYKVVSVFKYDDSGFNKVIAAKELET